ncbi:protein AMEIOTIC 1 homolog isoform X2 [Punica granatum]|uniref:Protein AMEIOTIC 1 homolog isoform X2 n=1 Tax=Punica granatum TaxID=22663 RepID=A0A6P8E2N8_PUNGR|nr:protein AMEIOTIC 1 homolog isoform X2 [Punica granatum]
MVKVAHCGLRSYKDSHLNQIDACNLKGEEGPTFGEWEGAFKKGICWFELQRAQMAHRSGRRATFSGQGRENSGNRPQFSFSTIKEEDGEAVTAESLVSEEDNKRDFPIEEAKPKRQRRQKQTVIAKPKRKKCDNSAQRWSKERYKQAEQHLLEILRAEGAVRGKPISRPQLRLAGRKHIGDTGLLDHLLKHIDGKVAPGGAERFRRWHNTDGIMEYWLESAELDHIRREAGVQDPYWVPSSWWNPGSSGALEEPASSSDMKLIKEDIINLKRELAELVSKKKDQEEANLVEGMLKDLANWRAKADQRLIETSSSLSGMQDMYREVAAWRLKIEQQLMELTNSLSSMQAAKAYTYPLCPENSERWEDLLESTNLENVQGDDIASWLANTDPSNGEWEDGPYSYLTTISKPSDATPAQDAACASELAMLKEEVAIIKRDMKELVLKKQECLPKYNQDASLNVNPQLDFENPSLLFQRWKEMEEWRSKMDQQMKELSNAVRSMQATKPLTACSPSPAFYV